MVVLEIFTFAFICTTVLFATGLALQCLENRKIKRDVLRLNELYNYKSDEYLRLLEQKKSSEVKLGHITEQLAPFLEGFNMEPGGARFVGGPIDYIVFRDNEVVFLEVKSGDAKLSKKQRDIKKLIQEGKVRFDVLRVK